MADLKQVYGAVDEESALYALEIFDEKWSGKSANPGGRIGRISRPISAMLSGSPIVCCRKSCYTLTRMILS